MLNAAKASSTALLNAARSQMDKRQYAIAASYLQEIVRRDPGDHAALSALAESFAHQGNMRDAIHSCVRAVCADESSLRYKEQLLRYGGGQAVERYSDDMERALVACLKSAGQLDCGPLRMLWMTHLICRPDFYETCGKAMTGMKSFDPENEKCFSGISTFKPLLTPCFLLGVRHIVAHHPIFEEFITHVRRRLLEGTAPPLTPDERHALAEALAHYSFHTDYILDVTESEQKKIDELRARIENGKGDAADIALFACYAPLCSLKNGHGLAGHSPSLAELIQKQVLDHIRLNGISVGITALTAINDAVSARVREQYETFPYPRWTGLSKDVLRQGWKSTGRNEEIEGALTGTKAKILIAGCGTGQQAITYGALFPDAEILAVDLSRASLAYAIDKAKEYDISNIAFHQADLLQLGGIGQTFDYVISVGVLHHLQDPMKGWSVLRGLLKPGGLMRIGLYSTLARRAVAKARDVIRAEGFASDIRGMRDFRRKAPRLLEKSVMDDVVSYLDYYYLTMYRDLLFHVQEHSFDIPSLEQSLKELELDFISFMHPQALNAYARAFPGGAQMTDMKKWQILEEKNTSLFKGMYVFWCRDNRL